MKNSARLGWLCCALVSFFISSTSCAALPLSVDAKHSIELNSKNETTSITLKGFPADAVSVFDVENPDRIVVDIAGKGIKVPKGTKAISNSCIKSVRFGTHSDKTRIVFDRTEAACNHVEKKSRTSYTIDLSVAPKIAKETKKEVQVQQASTPLAKVPTAVATPDKHLTPSSAATPIEKSKEFPAPHEVDTEIPVKSAVETPLAPAATVPVTKHADNVVFEPTVPPVVPTKVATEGPTQTPTQIPTELPTAVPTNTPAKEQQDAHPLPAGTKVLKEIIFSHDNDQGSIRLSLNERSNFKLTRANPREYRISIADCTVAQNGLTLPQFPPNDMVGFTLVQATPSDGRLDVIIGVDDGMKLYAVNNDSVIIVRAEPAGF